MTSNDLEILNEILAYHRLAVKRMDKIGNDQNQSIDRRKHAFDRSAVHSRYADAVAAAINASGYTAVDVQTAAADGFRDGRASVVVDAPALSDIERDLAPDGFDQGWRFANSRWNKAIIAAGGTVKEGSNG